MPSLDPATRNITIGRLQAGESQNEVARTLNVNQNTISKLWNINVLPWPSKSPDDPIEHPWDQLDKRVRQRQPRLTPPNVATGMANNTKKQCEKFDWVYAKEVQSSVGRAWWSYTVLTLTWPEVCWTVINWLFFYLSSEVWTVNFSIINIPSWYLKV